MQRLKEIKDVILFVFGDVASKAAVDAITISFSQELGPRKIRVNSLDPGSVETEGLRASGLDKGAREPSATRISKLPFAGSPSRKISRWSQHSLPATTPDRSPDKLLLPQAEGGGEREFWEATMSDKQQFNLLIGNGEAEKNLA
jgi:hypothetical protein